MLEVAGVDPHANASYTDHSQVVWNLYNRDCDGGATYVDARSSQSAGYPPDVMTVVSPVIAYSPPIPHDGLVFRGGFPEDIRHDLINALMEIAGTPEGGLLLTNLLGNNEGLDEHDFGLYQGLYDLIYQAGYTPQYVWDTYFNP
jgi:ABC-type phosphate/phosphonate transport system substrate-binding protein